MGCVRWLATGNLRRPVADDLGRVTVAGEDEAILLEGELGGPNVALAEHQELRRAPGVV